ncbi:Nucleolar GTP-binding protein 2 [Gurleya vavrai]
MSLSKKSAFQVLLSKGKVPFQLLSENKEKKKKIEYQSVFGKKAIRKKPKITKKIEDLVNDKKEAENKIVKEESEEEDVYNSKGKFTYVKGQSRRIWNELYKVVDSSDVVIHVLDARDPLGTRCPLVLKYLEENPHKHLVYVLNKVDLIPTSVTAKWMRIFSKENATIAYHSSSLQNFYGKNNLMNILRQYSKLKEKDISIGFIGYPNVGKSSIINTLRNKKVCSVAPVPGQTKVWQYINLTKKINLIDCPGIVPMTDEKEAVLRGAVRIENVIDPEFYVNEIMKRASKELEKVYGFKFVDCDDFLEKIAVRFGKLLKNGEKDTASAAKIVLHDWCRGKINYFIEPVEEEQIE